MTNDVIKNYFSNLDSRVTFGFLKLQQGMKNFTCLLALSKHNMVMGIRLMLSWTFLIYIADLLSTFFGRISEVSRKSFNKTPKLIKVQNIVAILILLAKSGNFPVQKECHFQNF